MGWRQKTLTGLSLKNHLADCYSFVVKRLSLLAFFFTVVLTMVSSNSAMAAKTFKNCTELNKVYKGGVALPGAINQGGVTKYEPKYSKALYLANKKSDRDNDGIACER